MKTWTMFSYSVKTQTSISSITHTIGQNGIFVEIVSPKVATNLLTRVRVQGLKVKGQDVNDWEKQGLFVHTLQVICTFTQVTSGLKQCNYHSYKATLFRLSIVSSTLTLLDIQSIMKAYCPIHRSWLCAQEVNLYKISFLSLLPQMVITRFYKICDAIQGNQSELEHVTFLVFYLIGVLIWRGTLC